jgi:hypothetical protein
MDERAMAISIATSGPPFLQLPYPDRLNIYKLIGIASYEISDLKSWIDHENNGDYDQVPRLSPSQLFHPSKEGSTDALSVFWSQNTFLIGNTELHVLLQLGAPIMWSSLREMEATLELSILPDKARSGNADLLLPSWRQACVNLGAHLPPSQLRLYVSMRQNKVPHRDQVALAKSALGSMLQLPVLKEVSIKINPLRCLGLHRMTTHLLKCLICPPTDQCRSPFRFMGLPREIQDKILEYTDLVAPGPVAPSRLKGYILEDCYARSCGGPSYHSLQKTEVLLELSRRLILG